MNISYMHILGGIILGAVTGKIFATFTLRKLKWKKIAFILIGICGSLMSDLIFRFLYKEEFVSNFFYKETTIVFEMIVGAFIACYILNLFSKKEIISFDE